MHRLNVIFFITFLSLLSGTVFASKSTEFHAVHVKGGVTTLADQAKSPETLKFADVVFRSDTLFMDKGAELKLAHLDGIELWLAASASLRWYGFEDVKDGFSLDTGALQVETEGGTEHPIEINIPYAKIRVQMALLRLHRQRDGRSILDLENGELIVFHKEKLHELKGPIKVLIDEKGLHPMEGKIKSRAIFDFREDKKLILEQVVEERKRREENDRQSSASQDSSVRGKASDAKLVEGEADGEGEYRWDFSINPWVFLIPLFLISLLVFYVKRMQKNNEKNLTSQKPVSNKDEAYDSDEIYVWRGNLTTNDPPLKTHKTTHILGDVEDGVKIEANHDLVIKGSIQGAEVIAAKNLTVETGINGQHKAILMIGGELKASYISEAKGLVLGDVEVQQAIHGCTLAVQGKVLVEKKNIVGGWIAALKGVQCEGLGSDFAETEILLGMPATDAWAEKTGEELAWEAAKSQSPVDQDMKSSLAVMEEWVSATVIHGEAKLEQKDPMPGPVRTRIDPTDRSRLQIQGFKPDEENA